MSAVPAVTADRPQTLGEEIANAVTHGLGSLLALAALPLLVWQAARLGGAADVVAASVFGASLVLMYGTSALYHALPRGAAKRWFNRLDHAAIYVLIAGSYTPFTLGVLGGPWGWSLFGVVWAAAAVGVAIKLMNRLRHPGWSTGLYVAMGWVAVVAAGPLMQRLPAAGLAWLVAGGLCYTLGAVVFLLDNRVRYAHAAWHLFVLGGSVCHFFAAFGYARA
ncbi:MAG: hemolysin D [Leptothrix sp. (in: Bacteria)]|nr:hemolysin D [Leptothrix sp. (in: b-proteobacteria)]